MGTHRLEIKPAKQGERAAFTLQDLMNQPFATAPALQSPITGEQIPVPDGSLKAHLAKHAAELGGANAYVKLTFRYTPAPGEQPRREPPAGWRRVPPGSLNL